ncbi:MAG: hypothetical protein H7245_18435 [Candidatus Saccharibacteria bacterium]|nr:hypothetical protein [Pseudorhodobacter sp.]
MPIGSTTEQIHMINIAVTAADGSGRVWQDPTQMIPTGMYGNPETFVAGIKAALPLVNALRVQFNEYSFNDDGSMNPQFERFLAAAAAQGYQLTLTYGSGDVQNTGIGSATYPYLTNAEAYEALQANFADVSGAWGQMMDWMDDHASTAVAVYGWDLMNEAASYRNTVRTNGADATHALADFVQLYAEHNAALAAQIEARAQGRILVGGWGYNGDFLTLANTPMGSGSALDYLRAAVGDRLVWSGHLYPGWMGTNLVSDPTSFAARLDTIFADLKGDDLLITEMNIDGAVDDMGLPPDHVDLFADGLDWFALNGVGLGWYPGVQTGSSHLIFIEADGDLILRHQHSLAHALDAFSLGESQPLHDGNERIATTLTQASLRNEPYQIDAGEGNADALTKYGTAFGFGGADTLQGTLVSNDFLYGGTGDDVLRAIGGDDFLFGQGDADRLNGGSGIDHLFGGADNDTLNGGSGRNVLAGGAGDDTYVLNSGREFLREYANAGLDRIVTAQGTFSMMTQSCANIENLVYSGTDNFRGVGNALNNVITGGTGADTLWGMDGADTLIGLGGADRLIGGAGADRFVFTFGHDQIDDFDIRSDQILFRDVDGVTTATEALSYAHQAGADVVFDFGPDSMTVLNVSLSNLSGLILVD